MADAQSELHAVRDELLAAIAQLSTQSADESRAIRDEIGGLRNGLQIISEALLNPSEQKRVRQAVG